MRMAPGARTSLAMAIRSGFGQIGFDEIRKIWSVASTSQIEADTESRQQEDTMGPEKISTEIEPRPIAIQEPDPAIAPHPEPDPDAPIAPGIDHGEPQIRPGGPHRKGYKRMRRN